MTLPCHVQIEEQGMANEDDGTTAWAKDEIVLTIARRIVQAHVLTDHYSGNQEVTVLLDQFGLEPQAAAPLLLKCRRIGGVSMRMTHDNWGEACFDLEPVIRDLFYKAQAEGLLRQIRASKPSLVSPLGE